jgi:CheY-like chemotaxis protein
MKKVLVIDDEQDSRAFVRAILEPEGWQVEEAVDGVRGLEKAKALKPDLIVLDVQMPNKDGFQMYNELIQDPDMSNIAVVMLTGVADKVGIRFSGKDMGEYFGKAPDAYVEKPIDPDVLKSTVRRVTGLT